METQTEDIISEEIQVQCTDGRDDTDFFQMINLCRNKNTKALSDLAYKQNRGKMDQNRIHQSLNRSRALCELLLYEKSRKENQRNDATSKNIISTQNSIIFGSDTEGRYGIETLLQKRKVIYLSCFDSLVSFIPDTGGSTTKRHHNPNYFTY